MNYEENINLLNYEENINLQPKLIKIAYNLSLENAIAFLKYIGPI